MDNRIQYGKDFQFNKYNKVFRGNNKFYASYSTEVGMFQRMTV